MEKNNNFESKKNSSNKPNRWFKFIVPTIMLVLTTALEWNAGNITSKFNKWKATSEMFENLSTTKNANTYNGLSETIDKDSVAIDYLKHNLYVKWINIQDPKFDAKFQKIWEDLYQITYNHEFEWLPNLSEPITWTIDMTVKFTYKNNSIYIEFDNIKLEKQYQLEDYGTLYLDDVIYDYDIVSWQNKTLDINCKANKFKTHEAIISKIKANNFVNSKIFSDNYPELENTQLAPLNDINLWNEVFVDGDWYYREVNLMENWKYRPIAKIYFDKRWNIDSKKTNEELEKNDTKILWVDVDFDFSQKENDIMFGIKYSSGNELINKVQSDRDALINVINNAKIWPNKDFVWFNKEKSVRPWSNGKDVWLFKTDLIWLSLTNDNYTFQELKDKNEMLRFTVDSKDLSNSTVNMRNWNNQTVNNTFVTIWKDYYNISLNGGVLTIEKTKRPGENITEHMPEYTWDANIVNTISKKTNTYYNGNSLEYFSGKWDMITEINTDKTGKWTYVVEKQSTNINIMDLYNYKRFASTVKEIEKYQRELNTLDIDLWTAFAVLLEKNWVHLLNQDDISVQDKDWNHVYCKIDKKFKVVVDEKLYKWVEKSLNTMKDRLQILDNLCKSKVRWVNNWEKQDFVQFVWWWYWIWKKLVSQEQITSFISWNSNTIDIELLWWEWQSTTIKYQVKNWIFKILKSGGKSEITVLSQTYKVNIDKDNWDINVNPIEK